MTTSSSTYVLDACVVIALQKSGHLPVLKDMSERAKLVLIEEVVDELIDVPAYANAGEECRITLEGSTIQRERICGQDPASTILQALCASKTSNKDLGEAASIAWAAGRPDAMFVSRDAGAIFHALEELRGRAMSFFQFLAELVEIGALDIAVVAQIAEDASKANGVKARPPHWWSGFIQSHSGTKEQA